MLHVWTHYGRLLALTAVLAIVLAFDSLLTRPLGFVTGTPTVSVEQWVWAFLVIALTLIAVRITKRELINGVLAARSGAEVPQLVGDIAGMLIVFAGICIVLSAVFKRDITGFIAAGGASIMVLGLALRDMLLAAFTGVVLNVEKPFKIGDMIRVADKFQGRVVRVTWRITVLLTHRRTRPIIVPNLLLSNAIIVNLDSPDTRTQAIGRGRDRLRHLRRERRAHPLRRRPRGGREAHGPAERSVRDGWSATASSTKSPSRSRTSPISRRRSTT